jgi:hypothetical protein
VLSPSPAVIEAAHLMRQPKFQASPRVSTTAACLAS